MISGKINDENNKALSGATVVISKDSSASILAYGISDANGNFRVKANSLTDSLYLKISFIGYKTWTDKIQNQNQNFEIQLSPSSEELKEVLVESKILEQRGDTLSFSVAAFKGKEDRVIADVLKKMPGIEIKPGGQIYYQGKPIQKYYIEGLDLLEGRYNLANENLAADDVSKVEILENHQPIKLLDSLEFSERASLNIKLKNNITTSGTAEVGVGTAPLLWKSKITPMLFTKKRQAIVTYQSNNTGSDVSREIRDFSFENLGDLNIGKTNWLSIQQLSEPPFSQERWLDNNVHLGSVNFLQRLKKDVDFKVNLSYLNDVQQQRGRSKTSFFTPTDTINLTENIRNDLFVNTLQSKFTFEKNTKKNYLKNQLELNGFWDSQRGIVNRPDAEIDQKLSNPFKAVRNKLRFLKTLGKQLITFRSNTGYTESNQQLGIIPSQFPELLNDGEDYNQLDQYLNTSHFFSDNSAGLTKALGKFTFAPKIGFSIENEQLNSSLVKNGNTRVLDGDFENRLDFFSSEIYLQNTVRFKSKDEIWNLRLSTPVSFKTFKLEDENFTEDRKLERIVFEPNFYLDKKISAFWEGSISGGFNYNFGNIQQLYYAYILTNYRNLQRYNAPISERENQNYSTSISYRNPIKQLFLSGSYSFNRSKNNLLYSNQIGEDGNIVLQAIERENFTNSNNFNVNGSKYFSHLHATLKINTQYSFITREQLLNGNYTEVKNKTLSLNANLDAEIFSWLSTAYDATFSFYETSFENEQFQQVETTKHTLGLFFFLTDNQYLNAEAEYYGNSLSEANGSNYFMNLGYQYSLKKPKIDLNISWNNILNTAEFITAYGNEFSYVESRYELRPSQVVASVKFSF